MNARARADVQHIVGQADRILVMLHHDHRVAEVAQAGEGAEQAFVVALVQADGRLVEHVHHADQAGADLAGQADALRLATGQGVGLALQGQVIQAHIDQEAEAFADFLDDLRGDFATPARQAQFAEELQRLVDRQHHQVRQRAVGHEHVASRLVQARAVAFRARLLADVLGQFFAHRRRLGFLVAAFEVGNDALEAVLALGAATGFGEVGEGDRFVAAAVQHGLLHLGRQRVPRRVDVEPVVLGQRGDQLEVIGVATIPAAHRTGGQRQFGMHHHARGVEELGHAQAIAAGAGAHRCVEREQARFQLRQRVIADRAGILGGEQRRRGSGVVQALHRGHAVAQLQRGLEALGQALLDVLARAEAVDHRLDGVLLAQCQRRHRVDLMQLAVHAHTDEALRTQLVEHLRMLALAVADDRRQQHVALFRVQRQHLVDHLADRLRFQRVAMVRAARGADASVQQAQVVVDLGDRADGRTRVVRGRLLLDRDGRGQAFDVVQVRLFHHAQELARIGRQRLDIAALAFCIDGVERQRGLARAGQAGDHDQLVAGQVEVEVLQVVRPRAADADEIHRHGGSGCGGVGWVPGQQGTAIGQPTEVTRWGQWATMPARCLTL